MKKSVATASFSRDFSKYRKAEVELIESAVSEFNESYENGELRDFIDEQITELRSDLAAIDILESEKAGETIEEQYAAMSLCNQWVTNNIVPAPFSTHIALILWMHGRHEGRRVLRSVIAEQKKSVF